MPEPKLRLLPQERRTSQPRWEVWLAGRRIGWVQEKRLRGARLTFYEAIVPHPVTGKPVSLELHTDREERVNAIVRFSENPKEFSQHWS